MAVHLFMSHLVTNRGLGDFPPMNAPVNSISHESSSRLSFPGPFFSPLDEWVTFRSARVADLAAGH